MFLLLIVALLGLTCAAANPMPKDNFHNHNHQHHSLATLQPQTTRIFNWTLSSLPSSSAPDGVSLPFLLGINGQPGYETPIECFEGDRIILTVFNNLTIPSSIHFHGLFQNGTNEADGAVGASQCAIPPGGTFVYNFTTDGQSGTYWWHSHFKSSYLDGLRGPLIVHEPQVTAARSSYSHSQDSTAGSASYDREVLVSLADHYHNSSDDLTDFYLNSTLNPDGNEPVFQSGLINGRGQFNCSATTLPCNPSAPITVFSNITPGSKTRVRIINMAAFSAFLFSIDGHSLTVIEVDGVAVQPHVVDAITLNVAQRYSVIVTADQPVANYWMRARMYFMAPWTSAPPPMGFNPNVTAIWSYQTGLSSDASSSVTLPQTTDNYPNFNVLVDTDLSPVTIMTPPDLTSQDLALSWSFDFENRDDDTYQRAYSYISIDSSSSSSSNTGLNMLINSSYVVPMMEPTLALVVKNKTIPESAHTIYVKKGQTVQVKLFNADPGEHPFHLHSKQFWIMAAGFANTTDQIPTTFNNTNPVRRDTVSIPACQVDDTGACLSFNTSSNANVIGTSFGYAVIRFVADNPGVWLMHCHIEWHVLVGLVTTFVVGEDIIQQRGWSSQGEATCLAFDAFAAVNQGMTMISSSGNNTTAV